MRRIVFFLFALLPLLANAAYVRQFSPQGQIDRQSRATAVFSEDMTRLGQPDAAAPFTVDCGAVPGKGRWSDSKTWAYTLERSLKPGERCDFRLRANLKTQSGSNVSGQGRYSFFAQGPWPRNVWPQEGGNIEEDQSFLVETSAAVSKDSVEANVWCEADGVGQRLPVRMADDKTREAVLKSQHRKDDGKFILFACNQKLPTGARMKLVWGKGVSTSDGIKGSKEESFAYTVREPFKATFTCERERANQPCSPLSDLRLEFNDDVPVAALKKIRLVTPAGSRAPTEPKEESHEPTSRSVVFPKPFAQNASLRLELPKDLVDESGRPLSNAASFPLAVQTGLLPPLAKFPGNFGIIELKEGGILPVTLRNVESALPVRNLNLPAANNGGHRFSDQRLTDDADVLAAMAGLKKFEAQTRSWKTGKGKNAEDHFDPWYARELPFLAKRAGVVSRDLPKPSGSAEFEVVGIPLEKPGYHIVEIESKLLGAALLETPKPMYVRAAVLVTNLAVHLKTGKDNGLVWVTALDTGKPVEGAEVRVSSCDGKLLWQGKSDAAGRALIDRPLPTWQENDVSSENDPCQGAYFLFASARLGGDYSFVRSDWNEGIEAWRFGVQTWGEGSQRSIHTVFDRTLLRPGETVSMKHIARQRNSQGFAYPDAKALPKEILIQHLESGDEFRQPLSWDGRGAAVNTWKIPAGAKRGAYDVSFAGGPQGVMFNSSSFRVADFRLPVFTGSVQGTPARQFAPKTVPLALGLSFLNGGAAKGTAVEVSATVRRNWPEYKGFDAFRFNVDFDEEGRKSFALEGGNESDTLVADKLPVTLDKAGGGKLEIPLPTRIRQPSLLSAEMTFPDPNGEIQTIRGNVELWPAAVVAGIQVKDWASGQDKAQVEVAVLDTAGKPVTDAAVRVTAKRRIDYSHRKRIVGGFYAYENSTEFKDLGEICQGKTDSRGILACAPAVKEEGNLYLLAETRDAQGNLAQAGASYYVSSRGDDWFLTGNQDRIDLIPEKRSYAPGETARFQVRTPFREATALIAVETGGIIETFVQPLSRYKPVVELPVKGEWGPNVYVSLLAVRGRVQPLSWTSFFDWGWREPMAWFKEWWNPTQPTALVDLAKPAWKMGLAEIQVGIDAFRLKVEVTSDKTDYRPRDTATVTVRVTQPDGKPVPAGSEVAFAAVDKALLELRGNESWNLLEAMLQKRAYEVETSTAQSQVIGKRHFGKKAVPAGGGGGKAPTRELFDTLLLWNPKVVLDANGTASLKVPINDSLTEFRLVAVADVGAGLFGTGAGSLRTRQDLQIISGLPPVVRENDRYTALLTLRNGTAKAMIVNLAAKAGAQALEPKEVALEAEGAAEVAWTTLVPEGETSLPWEIEAADKTGNAVDRLKITQQIVPAVPVTVQQATMARIDGALEVPAQPPAGALPGKGGVEIGLSPRISTPPPGLKRFFQEYPFSCLEQKTSIAVGLGDQARWQQISDELPTYLDQDGLAHYFPPSGGNASGSPALTAYVLSITQAKGFTVPPEIAQRMEKGLTAFVEGRIKPEHWSPVDDLTARKLAALEALTRRGHKPLAAITSLSIDPMRLPTAALIDWWLVVRRLDKLPQRAERLAAASQELRNRLSLEGGRLSFNNERDDTWWWLMVSGDSSAFRLIEGAIDDPAWKDDLPGLVQGAMQRQQRGHWRTTTANAWASVALARFGGKFEKETVSGDTTATLGKGNGVKFSWQTFRDDGDTPKLMAPWPTPTVDGQKLQVRHEGSGKPWAAVQVLAALPVKEARSYGLKVSREVTPLQEKQSGKTSRGDLWRVRLTVEADQPLTWVALTDPIPSGARILGDGDGRDSAIATQGEKTRGAAWPAYVERTFSAYRAYYSYLPRGKSTVEYTLRLNNAGEFTLPPTRAEALYAPEIFGEIPGGKLKVGGDG